MGGAKHLETQSQIIKHIKQQCASLRISWVVEWCRTMLHMFGYFLQGEVSKRVDAGDMDG